MAVGTFEPHLKSDLDWVRFYTLDTKAPYRVADETIQAMLAANNNDRFVVSAILFRNTVVFSADREMKSKSVDDLSITWGRVNAEEALSDHLAWLESQASPLPIIKML